MYRTCIAVVDASRARLFTLDRTSDLEGVHEQLVERNDLVNLARRQRPSELFSDSRPGTNRTGNLGYTFDDHRDAHVRELDTEFSRRVDAELAELVRSEKPQQVILCASPRMLGALRDAGNDWRRGPVTIDEIPRDLVKLTPPQLREQLENYGLLPAPPARASRA
jgi:protein required for attachment to host cells